MCWKLGICFGILFFFFMLVIIFCKEVEKLLLILFSFIVNILFFSFSYVIYDSELGFLIYVIKNVR